MDDATEAPNAVLEDTVNATGEHNGDSGEEDQMLDWSKFASVTDSDTTSAVKRVKHQSQGI